MFRVLPPRLQERLHRKWLFKRTRYWKHSSVREPRNAVEPLKLNKYVALNCQMHRALIFKPFYPTKGPESCLGWEEGLPVRTSMPWSSSVSVCVSVRVFLGQCAGASPPWTQLQKPYLNVPALSWKISFGTLFWPSVVTYQREFCGTSCTILTAA